MATWAWEGERDVHDVDIFRPQRAVEKKNAASLWRVITEDARSGVCPKEDFTA